MTLEIFIVGWLRCRCVVFAIICAFVSIHQADAQQFLWQQVFNTGGDDFATGIAADIYGNIIVTGRSDLQPTSSRGCLTIKYNQDGDTIWTRWYEINPSDIVTDSYSNIILAGDMWNVTTNADMRIIKCDPDGNILWTRTYNNGENVGEFGYGVAVDSKNNIIVTGKAYYNLGDYITIKYDSSGNLLWIRTYNAGYEDYAQDVAVDDSDNVIVTGFSDSNINWDWCTIKYSPEGDTLWVRRYDVAITDWAFGVTTDKQGNVIVVGESHYFYPGSGGSSGMVVKYTPQGDTLWTKMFTDTLQYAEVGKFVDVTTDDQGNIYLAGEYFRMDTSGNNRSDYYIVKCDGQGTILWTFLFNYDNEDEVSGIALDRSRNIVITGSTNHRYAWGEHNFLTIKIKDIVNLVEDKPFLPREFIVYPNYPNPFNPMTTIAFTVPSTCLVVLKVYNLLGQELETLVNERKGPETYKIRWNAAQYASGVYIARLTAGNYIASQKLLLLR